MKRILLAIDATKPDTQAIDFACYIGRLTRSVVTGFFLENFAADEAPVVNTVQGTRYLDWSIDETDPAFKQKKALIDKNIDSFKDCCERKSVRSTCRLAEGLPAAEIIAESRYADLIILDAATSFNKIYEGRPTEFVKNVLKDAECPVIIAPGSFEGIDEIVFTYDGSRSAAFAIKQFTLLLPELNDKTAIVLHIDKDQEWSGPEKDKFLDWMKTHYSFIGFKVLTGNTEDRLFDYFFKRKNVFIVMGAYGRGNLSRFFRRSQADMLINIMTQPIFISHH